MEFEQMSQTKTIHPEKAALAHRLSDYITASWTSKALSVAAELRIADLLSEGPKTYQVLAAMTDVHAPSLYRLLQALATIDICRECEEGLFEITPMGELLAADSQTSLRSWALWWGEHLWQVWENLSYSVKTGKSARELLTGTEGFEHLERDPEAAAVFNQLTIDLTRLSSQEIVPAYDFSDLKKVVDIGGGCGELLIAIMRANPSVDGVLFDMPHAIEGAKRHWGKLDLDARCEFVTGDFFNAVPAGADAYILKNVIHDWNDQRSEQILGTILQSMTKSARLLLVEQMLPEHREVSLAHQSLSRNDLTMLVACGAQERTEAEYRKLLNSVGFRITRVIPAGPTFSILEALPDM